MRFKIIILVAFLLGFSSSSFAQSDISLTPNVWTDISEVAGIDPGIPGVIQNNGGISIRVVTGLNEPSSTSEGIIISPNSGYFDVRPIQQHSIWAFVMSASTPASIVFDLSMSVTPISSSAPPLDFEIELAAGRIPGKGRVLKFGERSDLPGVSGTFATIWDGTAVTYVPPTVARIHNIVSTDAADVGALISSGTITTKSMAQIIDANADFVSDGVLAGDAIVNDDNQTIAIAGVLLVDDLTTITIFRMISPSTGMLMGANNIGDSYRIVRSAGTGAALTHIQGLNAGRLITEEFVINNGITIVPTVKSYLRQFRMRIFAAGSENKAVGIITSTALVDGTVSASINNGSNQTLMAIFTVPLNSVGYIKRWRAGLTRKQAATSTCRLRTGQLDGVGYISRTVSLNTTGTSEIDHPLAAFILPGGADVWIECDADSISVGVSASFDIILEDLQ